MTEDELCAGMLISPKSGRAVRRVEEVGECFVLLSFDGLVSRVYYKIAKRDVLRYWEAVRDVPGEGR